MGFVDTSHIWPLRTVIAGDLQRLLRWPVLEPLLPLTRVLWPLVWLIERQQPPQRVGVPRQLFHQLRPVGG